MPNNTRINIRFEGNDRTTLSSVREMLVAASTEDSLNELLDGFRNQNTQIVVQNGNPSISMASSSNSHTENLVTTFTIHAHNAEEAAELIMIAAAANASMPNLRTIDSSLGLGNLSLADTTGTVNSLGTLSHNDNVTLLESYRHLATDSIGQFASRIDEVRSFFNGRDISSSAHPTLVSDQVIDEMRSLHPSSVSAEDMINLREVFSTRLGEHNLALGNEYLAARGEPFLAPQTGAVSSTETLEAGREVIQQAERLSLTIVDRIASSFLVHNTALLQPLIPDPVMLFQAHNAEVMELVGLLHITHDPS